MPNDKVFFLGAGFSKAIDEQYPTLAELTERITVEFEKDSINAHYKEITSQYKDNIENLLTYLSTDLPWKTERQKALNKALYIDITEKIQNHFGGLNDNEECETYQPLFDFIRGNQIPCITLNYDLLLEKYLYSRMDNSYQVNNKTYKGYYKIPIESLNSRTGNSGFGFISANTDTFGKKLSPVLKLHGSINWLWTGSNLGDTIYCQNINKSEDLLLSEGLVPYIVPPVLDKSSFYNNNVLKSIWRQASSYLKNANEIYIIGFSFPQTDLAIKYLFQSSVQPEAKIYIINTNQTVKIRYEKIFGKDSVIDTYCCADALSKFISEHIEQ